MTNGSSSAEASPEVSAEVVPLRHPGRWITAAVIAVLVAMFAHMLFTDPKFEWGVVRHYLFATTILEGLKLTIELTVVSMVVGILLGTMLAVGKLSPNPIVKSVCWAYTWCFRSSPVIVQLLFWYYLAAVLPRIGLGIPFGKIFIFWSTNTLITTFIAAILGLGLNQAAYTSEIVRGGILSVDKGQREAAHALGMTRSQTMRRIVLPQAMRVIIPPIGNEVMAMLKMTALVLVIALPDLLTSAQIIYEQNLLQVPLLIVASIWYFVVTVVLTPMQYGLERHYSRSANGRDRSAMWRPTWLSWRNSEDRTPLSWNTPNS